MREIYELTVNFFSCILLEAYWRLPCSVYLVALEFCNHHAKHSVLPGGEFLFVEVCIPHL